jgi:subtilisin family serine protease
MSKWLNFHAVIVYAILVLLTRGASVFAQEDPVSAVDSLNQKYLNWFDKDPIQDQIQGASVFKAYAEDVKTTQGKKILVAVIDGGVDINHPELQGKVWRNVDEIPGNGIDDDNNGYIDDLNGWNFIGNARGENVNAENVEQTRLVRKLGPLYENVTSIDQVPEEKRNEYHTYVLSKKKFDEDLDEYQVMQNNLSTIERALDEADKVIRTTLGKETYTKEDVMSITSKDELVTRSKGLLLFTYKQGLTKKLIEKMKEETSLFLDKHLNLDFNPRSIVGDNDEDITDTKYGNADIIGPDADHGTFVAGIIAAKRNNGAGIDGIAESVEIMPIRAIPNGDERDKDVALAIRYAVDNGARIINMSFGKDFSPNKNFVDDAFRYAEEKNVLVVHAAGNDAANSDLVGNYPCSKLDDGSVLSNWISVGASSINLDKNFCASFSNYGKHTVDLFAPGENIISLAPGNKYVMNDGTSFSCPVVSGVAALILSLHPELKPVELRSILLQSSTSYKRLKVYYPNLKSPKKKKTRFGELSVTGGIVNASAAIKLADKYCSDKAKVDIALFKN